jgi:hypothetical protein
VSDGSPNRSSTRRPNMSHSSTALDGPAATESPARHRFRLAVLAAGALTSVLLIWIATPLAASARSRSVRSERERPVTIDVFARTTSFRATRRRVHRRRRSVRQEDRQAGRHRCVLLLGGHAPVGRLSDTRGVPGHSELHRQGNTLGPGLVSSSSKAWTILDGGSYRRDRPLHERPEELKVVQLSPTEEEGIWTVVS